MLVSFDSYIPNLLQGWGTTLWHVVWNPHLMAGGASTSSCRTCMERLSWLSRRRPPLDARSLPGAAARQLPRRLPAAREMRRPPALRALPTELALLLGNPSSSLSAAASIAAGAAASPVADAPSSSPSATAGSAEAESAAGTLLLLSAGSGSMADAPSSPSDTAGIAPMAACFGEPGLQHGSSPLRT